MTDTPSPNCRCCGTLLDSEERAVGLCEECAEELGDDDDGRDDRDAED